MSAPCKQSSPIDFSHEEWADFCRKNRIRKLSLFGSVLRGEFGPDSDIDFLVEFEPEQEPTLVGLSGMELELSDRLGRSADLRTPEDLCRYFRDEVVASAEVLYEQK
ncbi:MAG TPA: nucleotidyltransferase family protein [bacterium]|nr:nucleotidyltransferase family protein [bacterium]HQO34894.1 nucleotidyltransferase family protein [bacterium]HQP98415.1 nucleotidyltransferase family protein [bacterium]